MKKSIKKRWQKLPMRLRAIANLLGILLSLFLIYVMIGSPVFSVKDAYRRTEKANLVGPSEILAQVRLKDTPYDHLVLAKAEDSVTLFTFSRGKRGGELVYIETEGPLTMAAAPDSTYYPLETKAVIPVVLFDSHPSAVRAEVELTLSAVWKDKPEQRTYTLSADREYEGCFLFTIEATGSPMLGGEGMLLQTLLQVTGNSMADTADLSIPATVRLYDEAENLLAEETITIRSAAAKKLIQ